MFVYSSYLKINEKTPMAELLSIQEVAQITGLHEITIRRYVRSGELEAVRIGRRIRVRREAVDRLMKPMHPDPELEPALRANLTSRRAQRPMKSRPRDKPSRRSPRSLAASPSVGPVAGRGCCGGRGSLVARLKQQRQAAMHHRTVEMPADSLMGLMGLLPPIGGDALADTEALYDQV